MTDAKHNARVQTELMASRAETWLRFCPDEFQRYDPEQMPCPERQIEQVLAWEYGARGLLLHGVPRTGKTRLLWRLLRMQFMAGRTIIAWDAIDFGIRTREAYSEGNERTFYKRLTEAHIVFIDDIGKAKITERGAEALFGMTDKRMKLRKPCLFTTNFTSEKLMTRIEDQELAAALLERLRECCEFIHIKKKDQK